MSQPTTIQFPVSDLLIEFVVTSAEASASHHTGQPVWICEAETEIGPSNSDAVSEMLQDTRSDDLPVAAADGRQWRVGTWHSRQHGAGPTSFSVQFTEVETLPACHELVVDTVRLVPSSYDERVDEETSALVITVKADLESENLSSMMLMHAARIREAEPQYFPVTRHGVEARERQMRLGRVVWEKGSDGVATVKVVLVEASYDDNPDGRNRHLLAQVGEPRLTHALEWAGRAESKVDALVEVLTTSGVLDLESAKRVTQAIEDSEVERAWAATEVRDLSQWE